jgi:Tail tubular protein
MADPTPTTELQAVNRMFSAIGIARLSTLAATDREDQNEARAILAEVTKEVQKDDWEFNTDHEYPLEPFSSKFAIPANALQVTFPRGVYSSSKRPGPQFTIRSDGGTLRVWDKDNLTFTITGFDELLVDIVWGFEFTELPEAARWYITVRAARQFANRMLAGQETIGAFSERDEFQARLALQEAEGEVANYSIFDSHDMAYIVDRGPL